MSSSFRIPESAVSAAVGAEVDLGEDVVAAFDLSEEFGSGGVEEWRSMGGG